MISEIYAIGSAGVSAFIIVEKGVMVHYGSYNWGKTLSFEGVTVPANDGDCEVLAVICGLMMCRNNARESVNIYTCSEKCQKLYLYGGLVSPFSESFKRHSEGLDIYADKWPDGFYEKETRNYVKNEIVDKLYELIQKNQ